MSASASFSHGVLFLFLFLFLVSFEAEVSPSYLAACPFLLLISFFPPLPPLSFLFHQVFFQVLPSFFFFFFFHGWDLSGYSRISGFTFRKKKSGFEIHFDCDFSPFRIQTLTWSHPGESSFLPSFSYVLHSSKVAMLFPLPSC